MPPSRFPLADSVGLMLDELRGLLRSETRLLKAELAESAGNLRSGMILLGVAALLALLGGGVLLDAAVAAMVERGVSPSVAALIVGGGTLFLGLLVALVARRKLSAGALTPNRSIAALRGLPADASAAARSAAE